MSRRHARYKSEVIAPILGLILGLLLSSILGSIFGSILGSMGQSPQICTVRDGVT